MCMSFGDGLEPLSFANQNIYDLFINVGTINSIMMNINVSPKLGNMKLYNNGF